MEMQTAIGWFQGEGVGHEAIRLKEVQLNWFDIKVAVDGVAKEVFRCGEKWTGKQKKTAQPFAEIQMQHKHLHKQDIATGTVHFHNFRYF